MTIRTPKHWAFVVIYDQEEDALGTAYQAVGDGLGLGQFATDVTRHVQLVGERGSATYEGRLLLGPVADSVLELMEEYCHSATELINAVNKTRGVGDLNCQDWVLLIVKSLEDARLLKKGTLAKAARCPRRGRCP